MRYGNSAKTGNLTRIGTQRGLELGASRLSGAAFAGVRFIPDILLTNVGWFEWLSSVVTWGLLIAAIDFAVVCLAVSHVVLNKRDVRAAIGWSGVIFLAPFVGSALYWMFGINRLNRKARKLFGKPNAVGMVETKVVCSNSAELLGPLAEQFLPLASLGDKVVGRPLVDAFAPAARRHRASHSLFVTSSRFSQEAVDAQGTKASG